MRLPEAPNSWPKPTQRSSSLGLLQLFLSRNLTRAMIPTGDQRRYGNPVRKPPVAKLWIMAFARRSKFLAVGAGRFDDGGIVANRSETIADMKKARASRLWALEAATKE